MSAKIKVLKDYPLCGYIIPSGTILEFVESEEPSGSIYKDIKGNEFHFDNSELMFSGQFGVMGG
ncbi:MAG: hypothetical protein KAS32_29400 [Candidatus Peribacteraceae bacterium]|nr:hypothetical protein [Candidatus Peribacteraceae bacterium]